MLSLNLASLINFIIIVFFSLNICLPKVYSEFKLTLLFMLCIIAVLSIIKYKVEIPKKIFSWYMLFIYYHLIWIGIGFFYNNTPEALIDTFRLYVIYALIFLLFNIALTSKDKIIILFKVMIASNFIIAIYTILLFTNAINLTNINLLYDFTFTINSGVHEGYTKIAGENVNSLFFIFPFLVTYYRNSESKNKKILLLNIIVTFIAIIISGRRMLQIIAVLTIVFNYILQLKTLNKNKLFKHILFMGGIVLISAGIIYFRLPEFADYINIDILLERTAEAFEEDSNNVRYIQIVELLKAFIDKPILGVGFGKGITSIVRSVDMPWSYEVTYVLNLYQTGLIGFTIYISLLCYNIYLALQIKRNYSNDIYIIPLLMGYICFLLACFSNPLFANFDYMWILYIIPIYYRALAAKKRNGSIC